MTDRPRFLRFISVHCAICGFDGVAKWSEGKGGTNYPTVWICEHHQKEWI